MKRLFFILGVCIVSQIAVAQCKPTITLSISGCSGSFDGRLAERTAEALFNHYMEQAGIGFRSKQECDAFVGMVKSELDNLGTGNCRIHVNVSPCTGCLGSLSNEANIIAIGQGSSFYSTNPVNEVNDWSKDEAIRRMGLDKNYTSDESTNVSTGDDEYDLARNSSLPVIDPDKPFVPVNLRGDNGEIVEPNEYYFGEALSPNDKRWAKLLEKESKELYTEYTVSENEDYSEIDFYADAAEDVLHTALELAEATGAVIGTTTVAGAIGSAVLADLAVSLIVEDGVALYKWIANGESVSTMDIFKNTLNRASFGVTAFSKAGLEEALVKDGWLNRDQKKFFSITGSIALRTIHFGSKLYDKLNKE